MLYFKLVVIYFIMTSIGSSGTDKVISEVQGKITKICDNQANTQGFSDAACKTVAVFYLTLNCTSQNVPLEDSIKVDSVVDDATKQRVDLPDVLQLKVTCEPTVETYDMTFLHVVNGEATEVITTAEQAKFHCGYFYQNETLMAFSNGFTCPCTSVPSKMDTNNIWSTIMQLSSHQIVENLSRYNIKNETSGLAVNATEEKHSYESKFINYDDSDLTSPTILVNCQTSLEGVGAIYLNFQNDGKRQEFCETVVRKRSKYSCCKNQTMDYKNTVHCLRLSKLWYTVYHLGPPDVKYQVRVNVSQQKDDGWISIPSFKQSVEAAVRRNTSLDFNHIRLLVPEPFPLENQFSKDSSGYHEDILVLHKEQVSASGDECNKAGTGFEAFYRQQAPCLAPAGSCIAENQPRRLLREDKEYGRKGLRRGYMLDSFAFVPKYPLRVDEQGKFQLVLNTLERVPLQVKIELTLSGLDDSKLGLFVQLYSIDTQTDDRGQASLAVTINNKRNEPINSSLRLHECSHQCKLKETHEYERVQLSPLDTKTVMYSLNCYNTTELFHCRVIAVDKDSVMLAIRNFSMQLGGKCICRGNLQCLCGKNNNFALSDYELRSAGFSPIWTPAATDHYEYVTPILCATILIMLLIGLIKAMLGLMGCLSIEIIGLRTFVSHVMPGYNRKKTNKRCCVFLLNVFIINLSVPLILHWIYYSCCHAQPSKMEYLPLIVKKYKDSSDSEEEINTDQQQKFMYGVHDRSDWRKHSIDKLPPQDLDLVTQFSSDIDEDLEDNKYIELMCRIQFVYRHLNQCLGNVQLPKDTNYCVRGHFFKRDGTNEFVFQVPSPMFQYWLKEGDDWHYTDEGIPLIAEEFTAFYESDQLVLEHADVLPSNMWPCINEM